MHAVVFYFAVAGALPLQPEGLPAAPFDISVGQQQMALREALVARSPGVRMLLFVRGATAAQFEAQNPIGSVTAHLRDTHGHEIALAHTGYVYYHGHAGLELTERNAAQRGQSFAEVELEAKVALNNVRVVWLDSLAKRVEDLQPAL